MKVLLASIIALTPASVLANEYQAGYSTASTCTRTEYREEYVPGTQRSPGYVKSWVDTIEVPVTTLQERLWHLSIVERS